MAQQSNINVLLREYIGMTEKPAGPAVEQPKGLSKLFIKLCCPPTDVVDFLTLFKLTRRHLTCASKLLIAFSCLVVPAWLYVIRKTWLDACPAVPPPSSSVCLPPNLTLLIALGGLLVLLVADALTTAEAQRQARKAGRIFTGSAPPQASVTPRASFETTSLQHVGSSSSHGVAAGASAKPSPVAKAVHAVKEAVTHPRSGHAPAAAGSKHKIGSNPQDVQSTLLKLETAIYGKSTPHAELGGQDLSTRVRKLCAQVGVKFPSGGDHGHRASGPAPALSPEVLAGVLAEIQQQLGV